MEIFNELSVWQKNTDKYFDVNCPAGQIFREEISLNGDVSMKTCTTCGKQAKDFTTFPCPNCSAELVRCAYCRKNKNIFKCTCGFEGP